MPEIPDIFAVPDEPRRWSGFGRWRESGWAGPGASLSELTSKYEDLLRSAEEMREIGNTRLAEDFQRMAEQVKAQVKGAQRDALFGRSGYAARSEQFTASLLARKPDGSWVEMPDPSARGPTKIAGGVGELPLKSRKTPDFIRSLKGDSDLARWLQRVAGAEAGGLVEPRGLVDEAYQSASDIRENPVRSSFTALDRKFGNKYSPVTGSPGRMNLAGLMFHLEHATGFPEEAGGGMKYLNTQFPGLLEEKALVGKPGSGVWGFSVGGLLDDIIKHGNDSKKAIAFSSMDTFGHPEYAEQIIVVSDYLEQIGAGESGGQVGDRGVRLQEGLAKQLDHPDLYRKQIARGLGGLEPEYVSPTGPTGHRLSPPMPPTETRLPTGGGPSVGTDPLRPMPALNYNLEANPEFFNPQRQLPRAALTPDDVFGLAERNVVGGMDLDMAATKEFWGGEWNDPRRPQPRSPAIGELMPGPKGGYPGGPPVGRGLTDFVSPKTGGRFQQGSGPAGWFDRPAYLPPPPQEPYGRRVPGGAQLQMQFASGKPIRQPVDTSRFGPVLSEFYKMFPGRSVKDAAQLLPKGARGLSSLMGRFGYEAVRLALKLPK